MSTHYVFLHGSPGSAESFRATLSAAPTGSSCHAWDLLDHSARSHSPDATIDDVIVDVVRRVRALRGSVTIVGHSFGAWVGGRALAELGEQVDHYVAVAGLAGAPPELAQRSAGFAGALAAGQLTVEAAAAMAADIWLPKAGRDPAHEAAIRADLVEAGVDRLCRVLRRHAGLVDPSRRVARSDVRATLLHATEDRGCPIAAGRDLASCFANGTFVELPGDSHFLHWTHAVDVARAVFG